MLPRTMAGLQWSFLDCKTKAGHGWFQDLRCSIKQNCGNNPKYSGRPPQRDFGVVPIITASIISTITTMKNQRFLSLLVGACLCLSIVSARAQNQTINIMAMGDSVTARGSTPESSFRYWLYVDLTNGGFLVRSCPAEYIRVASAIESSVARRSAAGNIQLDSG